MVPGYPYLWIVEVHDAPHARAMLVDYLSDPQRAPEYIATFQSAHDCDASGAVQRVLDADYESVATVDSIDILRRRTVPAVSAISEEGVTPLDGRG